MTENATQAEWIQTGLPELDRILGGGLLRGSLGLLVGAPGVGKTVLAHQIAFHLADRGESSLYLTGYSETNDKLLRHNASLSFFKPETIGRQILVANLLDLLREGVSETEDAIIEMAFSQKASLVVIDGFMGMRRYLAEDQGVPSFLYSLGAKLAQIGATTLVIVEGDADESDRYPEITVCDVIIVLRRTMKDGAERRLLQIMKSRGMSQLTGLHPFAITRDGLSIFPRFESVVPANETEWSAGRAAFGISGVDSLIGGGLNIGTSTLVAGSPGVGKTSLGLHFVAEGARLGEPSLFLGMMETRAQLNAQARTFGLEIRAEEGGLTRLLVLPGHDIEADRLASLIMEDVERRSVRRLVIDSAAELERGVVDVERRPGFFSALTSYLRQSGVTTYITLDIPTIAGPALEFSETPLSIIAENLLLLRKVEYRAHLHRVLSVLKMRFSEHDEAIHEYRVETGVGIHVIGPAPLGEGLLTGMARPLMDIPRPETER